MVFSFLCSLFILVAVVIFRPDKVPSNRLAVAASCSTKWGVAKALFLNKK